jgi:hypothetical protein
MAYIVDSKVQIENEIDIVTISDYPEHQTDDYLFLFAVKATSGDKGFNTTPTGWTEVENDGTNGLGFGLWYTKCTSNNEASITVGRSGDVDESGFQIISIRGADLINPIDDFANDVSEHVYGAADITGGNPPSVTTSKDGQLIITGMVSNDTALVHNKEALGTAYRISNIMSVTANIGAYSFISGTAGTTDVPFEIHGAADDIMLFTLAINGATANSTQIASSTNNEVINNLGSIVDTLSDLTVSDISSTLTTYNGTAVTALNSAPTLDNNDGDSIIGKKTKISTSQTGLAGDQFGYMLNFDTAKDISDGVFTFSLLHQGLAVLITTDIIYFDGSGNWAGFVFSPSAKNFKNGTYQRYTAKPSDLTPVDSSGTVDWTDIVSIGAISVLSSDKKNRSVTYHWNSMQLLKEVIYTGGITSKPLTPRDVSLVMNEEWELELGNAQGVGQDAFIFPITIGDGTRTTNYSQQASSVEWVLPSASPYYYHSQPDLPFKINAGVNDRFDFRASITATKGGVPFVLSGSNLATFLFNGWNAIGLDITWLDGVACSSASFINCSLNAGAGTFNNCSFSEGQSSVIINNGGQVTNSTFHKGNETYALEITEAGNYDLSGNSYNNYTTVVNVSATSGTVNITVNSGDTPTYVTAGANVNVISGANFTIDGLVDDTEVRIQRQSDNAELYHVESVIGGSTTYAYTSNNTIKLKVIKPGYKLIVVEGIVLSGSDATYSVNMQTDLNYI